MPFDSIAWQTGDAWGRGQMVESLQKQALLHNRSKDEVLALLGKGNEDYDYQLRYRVDIGRRIESRPVYVTFIVSFDGEMKAYKSGVFD